MTSDVLGAAWEEAFRMLRRPEVFEVRTEVLVMHMCNGFVRAGRRFCCERIDGGWRIEVWP